MNVPVNPGSPSFLLTDVDSRVRLVIHLDKRYFASADPGNRVDLLKEMAAQLIETSSKVSLFMSSLVLEAPT